jgi:hypothetical protein
MKKFAKAVFAAALVFGAGAGLYLASPAHHHAKQHVVSEGTGDYAGCQWVCDGSWFWGCSGDTPTYARCN